MKCRESFCLWKPHLEKDISHKLSECRDCPKEEIVMNKDDLCKSEEENNQIKRMKEKNEDANEYSGANSANVMFGATFDV